MKRYFAAVAAVAAWAAAGAQALDAHRVWHQGREITVVDRDGWAVYDGDILIGRTADVLARSLRDGPDGERIRSLSVAKSVTLGSNGGRWTRGASGVFEMPYVVESDPDGNVPAAVALFNQQLSGFLQAVPRTTQADYVAFTLSSTDNGGACSSSVGRIGGRQLVQGSHTCSGGTLVHEMGHAVGLWHEQEHDDRDRYLVLDLNVVEPSRAFNFAQNAGQRSATPYDYASIMHYAATSFSRTGLASMETIPAGIAIGQRGGYSAGDLEAIRRLYGAPPQQVTVTSLPAGLTVLVDGAAVTTPATFNWALGSQHTLDVAPGVQVGGGSANVFGRWNIDREGDLAARRTITVSPGNGAITAPTDAPAISTYTASFVRYKEVRLTTAGNHAGVGGTVSAQPPPIPLSGVTGTYYRDRQPFSLQALPASGAALGGWSGSYFYTVALTTPYRNPFRGPVFITDQQLAAYEYRATFYDTPFLTVRAQAQDGEALGLQATVTRSGAAATTERLPYNSLSWSAGQTGTIAIGTSPVSPIVSSMRYTFRDWDGDPNPTLNVTAPAAGGATKVVTANFLKEYQAFRQVIPSCAAAMTLGGDGSGWYAHGSALPITLSPGPGWVFVGWEGSLSGTSLTPSYAVNDYPNLIARFNTVGIALAVLRVTPTVANVGSATPITIEGTGFTGASEVYVAGSRVASQFLDGTRLTATVPSNVLPTSGMAIVTVTNRVGSGACSVSASGEIDVPGLFSAADTTPQTGWWWNSAESGRGFFIEKRGNNLFMAGYLYEADGRATWFSAAGAMSGSSFSGDMVAYRGGQTLNGAYASPGTTASPGKVTLNFTAADRATLSWPGGTVTLSRFGFGSGASTVAESGWWWSASEAGRGFSIETQGSSIFMAGFMYDDAGNPVWYAAQGSVSGNTFNGTWQQYGGGQALTGSYKAPSVVNANVGAIALTFTGSRSANLTLPNGRVVPLTRFDF